MLKQEIINRMSVKLEELVELTDTHTKQIDCINEGVTPIMTDYYWKIDALENNFSKLFTMVDSLEAKNYKLRSELDGIYKVLEMDACDIQKLQDKMEGK